jgi:hypothetical protein
LDVMHRHAWAQYRNRCRWRVTVVGVCLCATACGSPVGPAGPSTPWVSSLAVSSPNSIILIAATEHMTATAGLSNGSTDTPAGTWASDAPGVATVNPSTGLVTGVGPGQATISFDSAGRRATKVIRVVPNYGGRWSGVWQQTHCTYTGVFVRTSVCQQSKTGRFNFKFVFTQNGDWVSGTIGGNGPPGSPDVTADGTVSMAGDLVIRGASDGLIENRMAHTDTTWQLSFSAAGDLIGTIAEVSAISGQPGEYTRTGTIATSAVSR